ncbi:MAG: nuclear transport factor 2 family protein [Gemmatimonadota bacterium]|nr:nuclear transport factor 2 family protein [Gemmatimonadota bacterium]
MSPVFRALPVTVLVLWSACKIERTPPEFLERREPAAVERQEAAEELQARIALVGQALRDGRPTELAGVLAPTDSVFLIAPHRAGQLTSAADLRTTLTELLPPDSLRAGMENVRLVLAPEGDAAWFAADVPRSEVGSSARAGAPWRMTGVLFRDAGEWRLTQLHLSAPEATATSPAPEPEGEAPAPEAAGAAGPTPGAGSSARAPTPVERRVAPPVRAERSPRR